MKILWLCNIVLPLVGKTFSLEFPNSGGWLDIMSQKIVDENELVCVFPFCKQIDRKDGILHAYSFTNNGDSYFFSDILKTEQPDVIHIWGTEFSHTYFFLRAAESLGLIDRTVVSLQGMIDNYASHYYAFLPSRVVYSFSFRDFIRVDNIYFGKKKYEKRGKYEIASLRLAKHVIGRTDYDKAVSFQINPELDYKCCYETLRKTFYENSWDYINCEKHSIFVSSCAYPIKGFHLAIEAFEIVLNHYPDATLYVCGKDPFTIPFYRRTSYQNYLRKLINKKGLNGRIFFLGNLSERKMCEQFLRSNVFVCSSSIENSPNSVGEALIMGVPTVSSDVGGICNFIKHGENGFLYNSCAPYMLAYYIEQIFDDYSCLTQREKDYIQFDPEKNYEDLINIYKYLSSF